MNQSNIRLKNAIRAEWGALLLERNASFTRPFFFQNFTTKNAVPHGAVISPQGNGVFPSKIFNYKGMIPNRTATIMQIKLKPHTHKKLFLIWSLMSTSARPTPRRVAGTMGLMKVAQFLHTTMATAMGAAAMPKPSPIPIITGSIP